MNQCRKGRRSRKKEAEYLEHLQEFIDGIAEKHGAHVLWDEPLTEEKRG